MREELTNIERKVYKLVRESGEMLTTNVPADLMGAVPHLINKGLVKTYKKSTSPLTSKKKKFIRVIDA